MSSRPHTRAFAAAVAVAVLFGAAPGAVAQATVDVEVRAAGEVDGRVTLVGRGAEARTYTCETRGGRCTLEAVAGGRYAVRFTPRGGGDAPPERTVMIPPSGRVALIVGG